MPCLSVCFRGQLFVCTNDARQVSAIDLRDDSLIHRLKEYKRPVVGIYALYPPGRMLPRCIQDFSDFLAKRFGEHPYWDEMPSGP
jgi:DNA-binding transcriptional LysR family regulator